MNAWPALQTLLYDGWVLRFANGYTRRANSASPLYPGEKNLAEKIAACEALYRARGLRTLFKLTAAAQPVDLDEALASRGYTAQAPTSVQVLELSAVAEEPPRTATLAEVPAEGWLAAYYRMAGVDPRHEPTLRLMLGGIVPARCFASLSREGGIVACGLGVVQGGFVGLFDVVTDPAFRGQGYGRELVLSLLSWGRGQGAATAYLQVMLDNAPALGLYGKLGFREAYRYWYRVKA